MKYTDQQQAAIKDAYARRMRTRVIVIVLLFAAMAWLAITDDKGPILGISRAIVGPITLVALFVGWALFSDRNWRCPACNTSLGRAFNPRHCRSCGIALRG